MLDVNPEEVAVEMLKEALPGFSAQIIEGRDSLGIRGALPIGYEVSRETIWYPIPRSTYIEPPITRAFFDAFESDRMREIREAAERAKQREALRHELEPVIAHIADGIRRFAIEAVGLESEIAEREKRARAAGVSEGYAEGVKAGRRDMLAEIREADEANARRAAIWDEADDE